MASLLANGISGFSPQTSPDSSKSPKGFPKPESLKFPSSSVATTRLFKVRADVGIDSRTIGAESSGNSTVSSTDKLQQYFQNLDYDKKYGFVEDIDSFTIPKGLNEETIRLISKLKEEPDYDDDKVENMVDSWNKNLFEGKKICWEMLYEADIATRGQAVTRMDRVGGKEPKVEVGSLKGLEAKIMEKVDKGFELLHNMVAGLQSQLDHLRGTVADLQASGREENKEEEREEEKEEDREEDKEDDEEEEVQPLKRNRKPKTKPSTPIEEPEGKRKRLRSKALGSPFTEEKKKKEKEAPKKKTRKR